MKKYIIIVFALCAGASYAQQPRIDSMLIDGMKSELHVYGSFGSNLGKVWVDSVDMAVKNWTDTVISTSIPDTGRGSAGPVLVQNAIGTFTGERMISVFKCLDYTFHFQQQSIDYEFSNWVQLVCRIDLQSILMNKNYGIRTLQAHKTTSYRQHCINECPGEFSGPYRWAEMDQTVFAQDTLNYKTGFQCLAIFDPLRKTLEYGVRNIKGFIVGISLHDQYGPPDTTIPVGIHDFDGEFTLDSQFNFIIYSLDTTYPYGSPHDIIYRDGSIIFPPPSNLLAVQTASSSSSISLSAFPNPSSKELNISYSLPENMKTRIILYDLEGRVIREAVNNGDRGEHQIKWDVAQLASGNYILGLITSRESKSQVITIIH